MPSLCAADDDGDDFVDVVELREDSFRDSGRALRASDEFYAEMMPTGGASDGTGSISARSHAVDEGQSMMPARFGGMILVRRRRAYDSAATAELHQ